MEVLYLNDDIVTVVVLAYNSENTLLDTLNSIYQQTYPNLNLIINDDCSTDKTVEIISKWIEENNNRFMNVMKIFNKKNMGISKSFDNALKHSKTKWVKFIAADDILLKDCISKNMMYINKMGIDTLLYSISIPFKTNQNEIIYLPNDSYEIEYIYKVTQLPPNKQYRRLLKKDFQFSQTGFINSELYKLLGGIDTSIRNIEDWPLRLLYTSSGYKLYFMNTDTVMYRIDNSVSHSIEQYYNFAHIKQIKIIKQKLIYPKMPFYHFLFYANEFAENVRYYLIIKLFHNKKNKITKIIAYSTMIFDSNKWKKFFKR